MRTTDHFLVLMGISGLLATAGACASDASNNVPGNDTGQALSTITSGAASTSAATGSSSSGSPAVASTTSGASLVSGSGGGVGSSSTASDSLATSATTGTSGMLTTTTGGGSAQGGASSTGDLATGDSTTGSGGGQASGTLTGIGGTGTAGGSGGTSSVDQSMLPDVTLHLAGDSTVMTYDTGSAQEGWGQELGQFFIEKVSINNQAIGGASVRTFQGGSRWTNIKGALSEGDYVMIQFGANDSGTVAGRHVDVPDFSTALGEMIDEVEDRQATAILVTPSALQEWSGDMAGNTRLGPYADAMRQLGPMRGVLVDDLNARGVEYLNMIGQTAAQEIYIDGDKAHFTKAGATQMAEFVAEELARIGSPLSDYLKQP